MQVRRGATTIEGVHAGGTNRRFAATLAQTSADTQVVRSSFPTPPLQGLTTTRYVNTRSFLVVSLGSVPFSFCVGVIRNGPSRTSGDHTLRDGHVTEGRSFRYDVDLLNRASPDAAHVINQHQNFSGSISSVCQVWAPRARASIQLEALWPIPMPVCRGWLFVVCPSRCWRVVEKIKESLPCPCACAGSRAPGPGNNPRRDPMAAAENVCKDWMSLNRLADANNGDLPSVCLRQRKTWRFLTRPLKTISCLHSASS